MRASQKIVGNIAVSVLRHVKSFVPRNISAMTKYRMSLVPSGHLLPSEKLRAGPAPGFGVRPAELSVGSSDRAGTRAPATLRHEATQPVRAAITPERFLWEEGQSGRPTPALRPHKIPAVRGAGWRWGFGASKSHPA